MHYLLRFLFKDCVGHLFYPPFFKTPPIFINCNRKIPYNKYRYVALKLYCMLKKHSFLPLFHKFIVDSGNGKRLNKNGTRIKPQSVANYTYAYKLVEAFTQAKKWNWLFMK
jgi:hypothetical protein